MISQNMGYLRLLFIGSAATKHKFLWFYLKVSRLTLPPLHPPTPYLSAHLTDKRKESVENDTTLNKWFCLFVIFLFEDCKRYIFVFLRTVLIYFTCALYFNFLFQVHICFSS